MEDGADQKEAVPWRVHVCIKLPEQDLAERLSSFLLSINTLLCTFITINEPILIYYYELKAIVYN